MVLVVLVGDSGAGRRGGVGYGDANNRLCAGLLVLAVLVIDCSIAITCKSLMFLDEERLGAASLLLDRSSL